MIETGAISFSLTSEERRLTILLVVEARERRRGFPVVADDEEGLQLKLSCGEDEMELLERGLEVSMLTGSVAEFGTDDPSDPVTDATDDFPAS